MPASEAPKPRKGINTDEVEREILRLGGTVVQDKRDHVIFKFPGLPAVGVHCNRRRAPKKLVSFLNKALAGKVVSEPRAPEPQRPVDIVAEPERARVPVRPNPPRPVSTVSPPSADAIRAALDEMERRKAAERVAASGRAFAPAVAEPYSEAREAPLTWVHPDANYFDKRDPAVEDKLDLIQAAFAAAERDGLAWWWTDPLEWLDHLHIWFVPERHRVVREKVMKALPPRFGIAAVRPGRWFLRHHTYAWIGDDGAARALVTVDAAEYARFKVSWACGLDYFRRACRRVGIAV